MENCKFDTCRVLCYKGYVELASLENVDTKTATWVLINCMQLCLRECNEVKS